MPTIPLFTLAGTLLARGSTPARLVAVFQEGAGWLPGGAAVATVLVCAFFTSFTGASAVTILALGGLLYPVLIQNGFTPRFALGLLTASGSIGLLFPPSLPVILYGVAAHTPIDQMFLAGMLPGLLMVVLVCLSWYAWGGGRADAGVASSHGLPCGPYGRLALKSCFQS